MPAIPSSSIFWQRRHPSRLPFGSHQLAFAHCRSAFDGTRSRCEKPHSNEEGMAGFVPANSIFDDTPYWRATVLVTGRGRTERRILQRSMWYGLPTQPAPLVRGSSRRITIVRFRPADIRVINRRICLSSCYQLCGHPPWRRLLEKKPNQGQHEDLTGSLHIRTCTSNRTADSAHPPKY